MRVVCFAGILLWFGLAVWIEAAAEQNATLENEYLRLRMDANGAGTVSQLVLRETGRNLAAAPGLLQEGFGVPSVYTPGRRLHAALVRETAADGAPVLRFDYDCDGPNIRGLHVTRVVRLEQDEAAFRVVWTIENRGDQDQWVAPWVRNDAAPGGSVDKNDRIDLAALSGIVQPDRSGYFPASRNWVAATDPAAQETVYGLFHADHTHSFLALRDIEQNTLGFQAAFTPFLLKRGESWATTYRLAVVRGLAHIDFASDAIAAQIDYEPGSLVLLVCAVKPLRDIELRASVRTAEGTVWQLPAKRFDVWPGRLARCTYDWTAPADGPYELLAALERNGKPLPLGVNTGSPHGGLDTQFVVGTPGSATTMEAWTDAPYKLERTGRTLRRNMAALGDTAVWFEHALNKTFREDTPEPTGAVDNTVRIALARNERESFQLVIRPPEGQDLERVTVKTHDLVDHATGARIPAEHIGVFRVGYVPVRVPTHFENPTGMWPDPLVPFAPFHAAGGRCSPLWFTVYAAPDTTPGMYAGLLELGGLEYEIDPVELWIEVTVWDFTLPTTPALKTDFGFQAGAAIEQCQRLGFGGSPAALAEAYFENAVKHRVTLRELTQLPPESPDYAATLMAFEPRLRIARDSGATTFAAPPSLIAFPEQLRLADGFVVAQGIQDRAFCPIAAEPAPPARFRVLDRMQTWQKHAPNIPLMVATGGLDPFIPEGLDIWAVHLQVFETQQNRAVLERIHQGGEVWWFVDHMPPRPYGNLFLDFAAVEHRILFWQAWTLGVRGFHYWSVNYARPGQNPYTTQLDLTPANGNGFLVYPSADGPVNSIRWETIRDGIEDYDYLALLSARIKKLEESGAPESLLAPAYRARNLETLLPDLRSFPRNPETLTQKRAEIARVIQ